MNLKAVLGLEPGEMVALVGAGGKTTTAWRLLCSFVDSGDPVVFTTTTRVFRPKDAVMILDPNPNPEEINRELARSQALVLAAGHGERGNPEHAARSPYPADLVKLAGLEPEVLDDLSHQLPKVTWLVEADGAKGRLLKAPAEYEPVIPAGADRVIIVAGLDAIGKQLDEQTVHRPEIAAHLLNIAPGTIITLELFVNLISHPAGGLKGIPAQAKIAILLTQWNDHPTPHTDTIARQLSSNHRIGQIVWVNLSISNSAPKTIH
ncbi:MAG: putative selenium-dependent hydroxylase accessory protein YqeC [Chloroflexi bacterium]|nr:putative selenium-dependent hydroxylase accessory protein YqeC [Chloroflexota bacterium]